MNTPAHAPLVMALFTAFRQPLDEMLLTIYEHALREMPGALLDAAILRAVQTRRFCPTVAELREDAEACRLERIAEVRYEPCVACRTLHPGWDVVVDPAGVTRYMRCACWVAHHARLRALGLTRQSLVSLPPGRGDDNEAA